MLPLSLPTNHLQTLKGSIKEKLRVLATTHSVHHQQQTNTCLLTYHFAFVPNPSSPPLHATPQTFLTFCTLSAHYVHKRFHR